MRVHSNKVADKSSEWREQHIDLTNDADNENSKPLTKRLQKTPVPLPENVRIPKKTPIPLPANVRHATPSSSLITQPTSGSVEAPSAKPDDIHIDYIPLFARADGDIEETRGARMSEEQHAEKRRKLSAMDGHRLQPYAGRDVRSSLIVQGQPIGRGVAVSGRLNVNSGVKLNAMNGVPTVSSLNSALKSKHAKAALSSEALAIEARTLRIGRSDADLGQETVLHDALPAGRPLTESDLALEKELDSSDTEVELKWDLEEEFARSTFEPRPSSRTEVVKNLEIQPNEVGNLSRKPSVIQDPIHISSDDDYDSARSSPMPSQVVDVDMEVELEASPWASKSARQERSKHNNAYSAEEDHLLIFLKEVKKYSWQFIGQHFPKRKVYSLQSRYSHTLNKRDRSKDPVTLTLPPSYATEAIIDWDSMHSGNIGDQYQRSQRTGRQNLVRDRMQERYAPEASACHNLTQYETSSASERSFRRGLDRPRRSIQQINYSWPRRSRRSHLAAEDSADEDTSMTDSRYVSLPRDSTDLSEESTMDTESAIPVDKQLEVDFETEDAVLVTSGEKLPYLSFAQRECIRRGTNAGEWDLLESRDWQGCVIHVDLGQEELSIIERVVAKTFAPLSSLQPKPRHKRVQIYLKHLNEANSLRLLHELRWKLPLRNNQSISALLQDAREGRVHENPRIQRLGAARPDRRMSSHPKASTSFLIRQREMSLQSRRGWKSPSTSLTYQLKNNVLDSLGPICSFTGASGDVHTVAWSPDGEHFAAGAVCVTDPDSMQYNRANNLLYGDVSRKLIHELVGHCRSRTRAEKGPNSTRAMHVSQDPELYTTVSAVAFSPDGKQMYSAGYDHHVYVWQTSPDESRTAGEQHYASQPEFYLSMGHTAPVDIVTVSCTGLLATASRKGTKNAIKVITRIIDETTVECYSFTSRKADERPLDNILPTSLKFEPNNGRLLLAGFGANKRQDRLDTSGDICLWDVQTQTQILVHGATKNVFDVAFNPKQVHQPLFAVGCVAGQNVNKGTRSLLRLYDGRAWEKHTMIMELECPALDMNDVLFCPFDENLVTAGCTDGRIYIWDVRRPDTTQYTLSHGRSTMPLDDHIDPEESDTGVRFLSWGENTTRLYSGSSDGVVKVWDVVHSPEDVFLKNLITVDSGIMSGAFSPDKSRLLIGEVNGSISVLEVGRGDCSLKDAEKLKHVSYKESSSNPSTNIKGSVDIDSGIAIASQYLATGQLTNRPFGGFPVCQAVQGPNYADTNLFDKSVDAPFLHEQALEFQCNLAQTSLPQCSIASCNDTVKITSEEIGDSGRSVDRIPDELRKQWSNMRSKTTVVPGRSQCTDCGRPARPLDSSAGLDEPTLCERCSFACFRCGATSRISPETEHIVCGFCRRTWAIGALGYECKDDNNSRVSIINVPPLKIVQRDFFVDSSFGDEVNALTDHYFSLAIDRPASPSL